METKIEKLKCPLCTQSFPNNGEIKRHVYISHTSQKDYCESKFALHYALVTHEKTNAGGDKVTCDICKITVTAKCMKTHQQTAHSKNKCIKCSLCSALFSSIYDMKKHFKVHSV